jgi:hypothetical protein
MDKKIRDCLGLHTLLTYVQKPMPYEVPRLLDAGQLGTIDLP